MASWITVRKAAERSQLALCLGLVVTVMGWEGGPGDPPNWVSWLWLVGWWLTGFGLVGVLLVVLTVVAVVIVTVAHLFVDAV